jgi:signal transduction histidine kinase/phage shock protein PspC (stress-responsive transcriptional regulator)
VTTGPASTAGSAPTADPRPAGPAAPRARLPLLRPWEGRRIAGVCAGVAAHLDVPVSRVRLIAVIGTLAGGAGLAMYLWLWATVPAGDPVAEARARRPAESRRLAALLHPSTGLPVGDIVVGVLLLLAAGLLLAWRAGLDLAVAWLLPALILLAGAGLAWSQIDDVERGVVRGRSPIALLRVGGGALLVALGVLLLVGQGQSAADAVRSVLAGLAVLLGLLLVLAPLWLRLVRQLGTERAARAREAERADIAAHLHDSVLQTLALIRARADDADAVARLARAQERELRAWLYTDRPRPGDSVVAAVRDVAAEIEDRHGVVVDVVTVGDRAPGPGGEQLLAATREALVNAVVHGAAPVSVYVEAGRDGAEVFVRDRGPGFDPEDIPEDRYGVRESILGRMRRHGGSAAVRGGVGQGAEIHLVAPASMLEGGTVEVVPRPVPGVAGAPGEPPRRARAERMPS